MIVSRTFTFLAAADTTTSADRRTVAGTAVPWNVTRRVSAGDLVRFRAGSVTLAGMPIIRDHDPQRVIGVVRDETATAAGLEVVGRISATPLGDEALVLAGDGALRHWSVGVLATDYVIDETGPEPVVDVISADPIELSLLIRGAYGDLAAVTHVHASLPAPSGDPVVPESVTPAPAPPAPVAAAPAPFIPEQLPVAAGPVTITAESYPYTFAGVGPSMIADIVAAMDGNPDAQHRVARAQAIARDSRAIAAGAVRMATTARRHLIQATVGTTSNLSELMTPETRPDLWVPLISPEAPLWGLCEQLPIADFTSFVIPSETTRTALSGTPADEVTQVAAGTIDGTTITITPQQVMGTYQFSRQAALSTNPAIDLIALNALEESWLADVEARCATHVFTSGKHTARTTADYTAGSTDGKDYVVAIRKQMATMRLTRKAAASALVVGDAEYNLAIEADDTAGRPLLPWAGAPSMNAMGSVGDGAEMVGIYGRPVLPQGSGVADNKSVIIRRGDLVAFATPTWNFRFEAVPAADGSGMNPLVLQLTRYSGVAFWTRRVLGVVIATKG